MNEAQVYLLFERLKAAGFTEQTWVGANGRVGHSWSREMNGKMTRIAVKPDDQLDVYIEAMDVDTAYYLGQFIASHASNQGKVDMAGIILSMVSPAFTVAMDPVRIPWTPEYNRD